MQPLSDTVATARSVAPGALVLDGRFRIKHLLGQGGMGTVYLGEQVSLNRPVAIKLLKEDLNTQPGMAERFRREALLLSSVEHASVVRVVDFGLHENAACLVMEYVEGETLDVALREGPFAPARALPILIQLCQGLSAIHEKGIVHRDLKAENVVLTKTSAGEQARLLDFGIARLASPEPNARVTQLGFVLGTPEVLSPEQALGQELDSRSDLYSLGVVAYKMMTGKLPFPGPTAQAFVAQHVSSQPTPITEAGPQLARYEDLCRLVMSCLEKSPQRRPESALAMANELARISLAIPEAMGASRLSVASGGIPAPRPSSPADDGATVQSRRTTEPRKLATRIAVGVAALAAAIGILVFRSDPLRTAKRLLADDRGSEALQVLDDAQGTIDKPVATQLKAAALHQVNRHNEEFALMEKLPTGVTLEREAVESLAYDYGKSDSSRAERVLDGLPKAAVLPVLQNIANREPGRLGWGALRYVDGKYAGQGLNMVSLYSRVLESSDCDMRSIAARRLGELHNSDAVSALRKLKELPRKKSTGIFGGEDDCGQDAASRALKELAK